MIRKKLSARIQKTTLLVGLIFISLLSFNPTHAHIRSFSYVYDADYLPKGLFEYEQWLTYVGGQEEDELFSNWGLRSEFEYAIRPNFVSAFYLNFEHEYEILDGEVENHFVFEGISSEWFWRVMNPRTKIFGLGFYGEVGFGSKEKELEEKIILSKRFGEKVNVALNIIVEQEWKREVEEEGGMTEVKNEREAVAELTGGAAYRLGQFNVGVEFRHHNAWEDRLLPGDFGDAQQSFNIGPSFSYATSTWWATMTLFPQPKHSLNEMMEARLIFGIVLDQPRQEN